MRQRHLALIGCVLVAFTFRAQRYLATIEKSTTRLAECMATVDRRAEKDDKTFADALSTIKRHLKLLVQNSQLLGRFAHRTRSLYSTLDPAEVIEEAMLFYSRPARARGVSLTAQVADRLPLLSSDALRIHFLVSILIDSMLRGANEGGKVIVMAGAAEGGVSIRAERHGASETHAPADPKEVSPYWSIGQEVAADLGGHLRPTTITHDTGQASLLLPLESMPGPSC